MERQDFNSYIIVPGERANRLLAEIDAHVGQGSDNLAFQRERYQEPYALCHYEARWANYHGEFEYDHIVYDIGAEAHILTFRSWAGITIYWHLAGSDENWHTHEGFILFPSLADEPSA